MSTRNFDVLIVGAGISGINAAYRVQEELPHCSYAILESRHELGGTWSLFKYPGIRSDSDLHTFGFPWDPWGEDKPIADAGSIMKYLKRVASTHHIDEHIKYQHKVLSLDWKSEQQQWRFEVLVNDREWHVFHARYVVMCTGYYDYNEALKSEIPGIGNFKGQVIHPQFWPENLNYEDKKVVIVGSGATAVTLLPSMTEKAAHVTMLQRSPGYFILLPQAQPVAKLIKAIFPSFVAARLVRLWFIFITTLYNTLCAYLPGSTRRALRRRVSHQLPKDLSLDPHFDPSYNPGDQRTCISPDGDFFTALRSGKGSIETDHIETVDEKGIVLKSGKRLDADIIITATGLKIAVLGKAVPSIDGEPINVKEKFVWRSTMLQDVPNLAFIFGYTNLSWTLGSDATSRLFVRLVKQNQNRGMTSMRPHIEEGEEVEPTDLVGLKSTYVKNAVDSGVLPKAGTTAPWQPRNGYGRDWWFAKYGDISKGMRFEKGGE